MNRRDLVWILLSALLAGCACDATGPAQEWDLDGDCVAIEGYDPVAYFTETRAVPGLPELTHTTASGVRFQFANPENRERFRADPSAYPVAWGGWCAIAVAGAGTFGADPESFLVEDGRLFLFHDSIFFDAKAAWLADDRPANIRSGDVYWRRLTAEE